MFCELVLVFDNSSFTSACLALAAMSASLLVSSVEIFMSSFVRCVVFVVVVVEVGSVWLTSMYEDWSFVSVLLSLFSVSLFFVGVVVVVVAGENVCCVLVCVNPVCVNSVSRCEFVVVSESLGNSNSMSCVGGCLILAERRRPDWSMKLMRWRKKRYDGCAKVCLSMSNRQ